MSMVIAELSVHARCPQSLPWSGFNRRTSIHGMDILLSGSSCSSERAMMVLAIVMSGASERAVLELGVASWEYKMNGEQPHGHIFALDARQNRLAHGVSVLCLLGMAVIAGATRMLAIRPRRRARHQSGAQ